MDVLALRDNARYQLQQIKDVETGIEYLNKVRAIEVWAKAEKKDAELQNMIAEQKIRTQRILGQLIQEGQRRGEIAKPAENQANLVTDGNRVKKTLSDIGITRKESSTFQSIASIPDELFENAIIEKKEAVNKAVSELTTAGMVKLAKESSFSERLNTSKETERDKRIIQKLKDGETVVINMKTDLFAMNWAIEHNKFIRVDRATEYGNPFLFPEDGDRDFVCDHYEKDYLPYKNSLLKKLIDLKGKALGCWCSPLHCHADILKDKADDLHTDLLLNILADETN